MPANTTAPVTTDNLLDERFIGDVELATLLGWSKTTPAALRCRGRLPFRYFKIGSSIRYRVTDVTAHLNECAVNPKRGNPAA